VLRTALHHAFENGAGHRAAGPHGRGRRPRQVTCRCGRPRTTAAGRFALIVFETEDAGPAAVLASAVNGRGGPRAIELEEELRARAGPAGVHQRGARRTVAELQTVNEELQSINEEQKAATEELETGREEIQSINEELTTINQEHQSTIEELKRTNADLQNLIESTEIGTIFLDRAMRIRRFTPAAALFNFVAADQGRPLAHITHRLDYPADGGRGGVLESLRAVEREVASDTGEWYIVRINPYRSLDGGPDGAVLTFFDNTAQHRVRRSCARRRVRGGGEPGEGHVPVHAVARVPHAAERDSRLRRPAGLDGTLTTRRRRRRSSGSRRAAGTSRP
jgi:two-component system, chemotaxis family, CheB/CheR fusion protein